MKDSGKLKTIVPFSTINQQEEEILKVKRIQVRSFTSLLEEGSKKKPYISGAIHPNQCLVIVYTAGTTGKPKGVMLSHLNMASDCAMIRACDDTRVYETDSYFAFMPFGHLA
jgi:long-chain acyl-CoA synthetase